MARLASIIIFAILFALPGVKAQHIICLATGADDTTGLFSYFPGPQGFQSNTAFVSLAWEIPGIIPGLTIAGDFSGDGRSETALFMKVPCEPNMNPEYTTSDIMVFRPDGNKMLPAGTWFSGIDTDFDFNYVDHAVAGDFNSDGRDDIAVFYNNPLNEEQLIYVFKSDGKGFGQPQEYFSTLRSEFNFSSLKYAFYGDFNHNGLPDIAVLHDYPGEEASTTQGIFVFESDGAAFSLLPAFFSTTRQVLDFDYVMDATAADYDNDGYSDLTLFYSDPAAPDHQFLFFSGEDNCFSEPDVWFEGSNAILDPAGMLYMVGGHFNEDVIPDLVLFYKNAVSGLQEVLLYEGDGESFSEPGTVWSAPGNFFDDISAATTGNFYDDDMIRPTRWKDNHKGAISFTFDDGAHGAFEHGAECLDQAGLKGTFYVFTDTTLVYDFPLAGTSLIKYYRDRDFEIASHTKNHSNLGLLTGEGQIEAVRSLLEQSKQELDERFNQNTLSLSIPFGSFRYETLGLIAETFLTARSSEYGYNLATPANIFALKSFPVLSTTSPATVLYRVAVAEQYGYYLPLMYHDIEDEYFDPETNLYTYSLEDFSITVDSLLNRDVWVDTHENVYKYIMERNGLKITMADLSEELFSFIAEDGLPDSVFNVDLTLRVSLPETWSDDCVTVDNGIELAILDVIVSGDEKYVFINCRPDGSGITVHKGLYTGISVPGTETENKTGLKIYPNPVGNAYLDIEALIDHGGEVRLVVYNNSGSCMQNIKLGKQPAGCLEYLLDTTGLSPGQYFLQLQMPGKLHHTVSFIKL